MPQTSSVATLGQRPESPGLLREHTLTPRGAGRHHDEKPLTAIVRRSPLETESMRGRAACGLDRSRARTPVAAPSTGRLFLSGFGFGLARQLDVITRRLLARAVAAGADPLFSEW